MPSPLIFIQAFLLITCFGCYRPNDAFPPIADLKGGRVQDDSSYIYAFPFDVGKRVHLVQGYHSSFSHHGEYSSDFKVPIGTKVFCCRPGKVVQLKNDSEVGGLKEEYLNQGNHIVIEHEDGSLAGYWHLQFQSSSVKLNDSVAKGELIALSGNTGYSAFPHLHFMVFTYTPE
ncbi:MAG: murein DD-endopeptidase MepM/ murein hydrolase activator NlpD, partial [Bacteroidia bacterium]